MSKPKWEWTHTGANGERLYLCEGKLYTEFAWEHFLEAYTGKAEKRPNFHPPFEYGKPDFSVDPSGVVWPHKPTWGLDEITLDLTPDPKKP